MSNHMPNMSKLFKKWSKVHKINRFEGKEGVLDLELLIDDIGYDDIEDFLANNSEAIQKIIDVIVSKDIPEWRSKLNKAIQIEEKDQKEINASRPWIPDLFSDF